MEMNEENTVSYYAIIPAVVRYDEELTDKAKLLYGEITCLSNKEGYCFATNNYFAKLYKCTTRAIQNAISILQKKGYIKVVIEENYQRKIFISSAMGYEKKFTGRYENNFIQGHEKNFINNNINNNMIDRFFKYIINNESEFPKEFSKVELTRTYELLERYEMLYTQDVLKYISKENLQKIKEITYAIALMAKDNLQNLSNKMSREKLIRIYNECKKKELLYSNTSNEISNFINYFYKSIVNELIKGNSPSFFMHKKDNEKDNEESEEL